jgi:hypothetical protein
MALRHLEAEVRQKRGVVVLDVAYAEAESNDPEAILLNFEDVDYINSTGIALKRRNAP